MNKKKFKIGDRLKSFKFAFNGIRIMFANEHNAWIHLAAALLVIIAGIVLKISASEWVAVSIAIGLVFTSEAINTSIEKLSDFVSHEKQNSDKRSERSCCGRSLNQLNNRPGNRTICVSA